MILITAAALSPFTPNLSKEIFSLFGEVDQKQIEKIYQEDFEVIKEVFINAGKTPVKTPKVLVPKIEDDAIGEEVEKLKALKN